MPRGLRWCIWLYMAMEPHDSHLPLARATISLRTFSVNFTTSL